MSDAKWQQFEIFGRLADETLATALRFLIRPEPSWGQVRKLLQSRKVLVNGNMCQDEARRVKKGDRVRILTESTRPLPKAEQLPLVYVDADLLVVDKPAGLLSVRHAEERDWSEAKKAAMPTLEDLLPAALAAQGQRQSTVLAVHRLDRDTSGLMVFARNVRTEMDLVSKFKDHTLERRYLAVVRGQLTEPAMIRTHIARDRGDGRRGSLPQGVDTGGAQEAITEVRPVDSFLVSGGETFSVVECRLETGRTHQIRIHLSERGYPVAGDKVYFAPSPAGLEPLAEALMPPRQALHAAVLAFEHPISRKALRFESAMPGDLRKWMEKVRK